MNIKRVVLAGMMLFMPNLVSAGSGGPGIKIEPLRVPQGGIAVVTVEGAVGSVDGDFAGRKIHFNPSSDSVKAVIGVDLYTEPGAYPLEVRVKGRTIRRMLRVVKKDYGVQRLSLPRDMVELSPENELRVEQEAQRLLAIWPVETERLWAGEFINPCEGPVRSHFGLRRIINNRPKNPHSGVDIAAEEGTEVKAPNNGVVALVDEQFYSGRTVILDHGQGLYTMFFHLSGILVSQGQVVKKGEVIGLVGSTGRSTGAHLHWGVRLQGARVDPLELIKLSLE